MPDLTQHAFTAFLGPSRAPTDTYLHRLYGSIPRTSTPFFLFTCSSHLTLLHLSTFGARNPLPGSCFSSTTPPPPLRLPFLSLSALASSPHKSIVLHTYTSQININHPPFVHVSFPLSRLVQYYSSSRERKYNIVPDIIGFFWINVAPL